MYITNCQTARGNLLYDAGNPKPVLWDNLEWWAQVAGGGRRRFKRDTGDIPGIQGFFNMCE